MGESAGEAAPREPSEAHVDMALGNAMCPMATGGAHTPAGHQPQRRGDVLRDGNHAGTRDARAARQHPPRAPLARSRRSYRPADGLPPHRRTRHPTATKCGLPCAARPSRGLSVSADGNWVEVIADDGRYKTGSDWRLDSRGSRRAVCCGDCTLGGAGPSTTERWRGTRR